MISQSDLETIYRFSTRRRVARTLIEAGQPMDVATFSKSFSNGDLDDAVHCDLVTLGVAGITLTEQGRALGRRELDAQARSESIEAAFSSIVGLVRQSIARHRANGAPRDKSRGLR